MKNTIFFIGIFCSTQLSAQQNTVATGGDASGTGGSVSFTVGQIDYSSFDGAGGNINQGVQQPYEFFLSVGLEEHSSFVYNIYPNPTTSNVMVELNGLEPELSYVLTDAGGNLIMKKEITSLTSEIDMSQLSSGYYNLCLLSRNETIEHIKIIKN